MIKVRDVMEAMETWAPSSLAESWDNVGLITGDPDSDVSHIIVTLDVTEEVMAAAGDSRPAIVISHHPPIFKPLFNITGTNPLARTVRYAVKHDIALFASHTNLDQAPGGVSGALAEILGLQSVTFLSPGNSDLVKFVTFVPPEYTDRVREAAGSAGAGVIGEYSLCSFTSAGTGTYIPSGSADPFDGESGKLSRCIEDRIEMIVPSVLVSRVVEASREAHPYDEMAYDVIPLSNSMTAFGYGAVGELDTPVDKEEFINRVAGRLKISSLRVSTGKMETVKQIAVMGGSGSSYIGGALDSSADAFVTGEIGYHDFVAYGNEILLVDATHRATELPVLEKIRERLVSALKGEKVSITVVPGIDIPVTKRYDNLTF